VARCLRAEHLPLQAHKQQQKKVTYTKHKYIITEPTTVISPLIFSMGNEFKTD
jgi:hypothetical protein